MKSHKDWYFIQKKNIATPEYFEVAIILYN